MLRIVGLVVLLIIAAAGGWYMRGRFTREPTTVESIEKWGAVSAGGAARARQQIATLGSGSKAFVVIAPEDLAAHVFMLATKKLPPESYDVRATAEGDRVMLRAMINPDDVGAKKILGPLASLLGKSEELRLTGTFHLVRPGLAELRITDVRLRDIPVPSPLVPALLRQFSPAVRPEGVADNALPVPLPEHVQDIRVSEGRMLVYRRNP